MATIRQIAKAAQVSPMTVSFVLNNKPGQVSDETRERVLQVVREMGYRPRATAERPHSEEHVSTLGIVSGFEPRGAATGSERPTLAASEYYTSILSSLMVAADEQRQNITLFTSSLFHEDPRLSIRTYCDGRTDGLLVIAPGPNNRLVPALHERGIPCVLLGDRGDFDVSSVDVDNHGSLHDVTAWMIEQGHRRIAFLGFPGQFVRSAQERKEGYCAALTTAGIPIRPDYILDELWKDAQIYERLLALARLPRAERPTALLCWNDTSAARALMVLNDAGLRVPEDISVTGFDDDAFTTMTRPPLTTVRQPYAEIGAQAISALRTLIAQRPAERVAERITLPGQLIIRNSVAPPAGRIPGPTSVRAPQLASGRFRKEAIPVGNLS